MPPTEIDLVLARAYFHVLADLAQTKPGETITYGNLVREAKARNPKNAAIQRAIATSAGRRLEAMRQITKALACNMPDLSALVVNNATGSNGRAFQRVYNGGTIRAQISNYDWKSAARCFDKAIAEKRDARGTAVLVAPARDHSIDRAPRVAPRPYVFNSDVEFERVLQSDSAALLKNYLAVPFDSIEAAVIQSVAGNTFRAFRWRALGVQERPSNVYRQLVTQIFKDNWQRFAQTTSEEDYDRFVLESAQKVEQQFDGLVKVPGFMGFGRASKLFNLSCKAMLRFRGIKAEQREVLIRLAHVPWDSFTLQGIRLLEPPFNVPARQGMGWEVLNEATNYLILLKWIREKCYPLGFSPLHYEVAAWDRAHP